MIHRPLFLFLLLCLPLISQGQTLHKQVNLHKWKVQPANYSGITYLGNNQYAVVDDKSSLDGFYLFRIELDSITGKVKNVFCGPLMADHVSGSDSLKRSKWDCEDLVYLSESNTYFIASESEQVVLEYDSLGRRTGRQLSIPQQFGKDKIINNRGFESLAYHQQSHSFWLTTENGLKADGGESLGLLRIQSFNSDLSAGSQWAYRLSSSRMKKGKFYAHGVSALTMLDDGRLLVMEREVTVSKKYLGSVCEVRIFLVNPLHQAPIDPSFDLRNILEEQFLQKQELFRFKTNVRLDKHNFANYEGMTLGPRLADGRQTLLLICDSQAGTGNSLYHLHDYLKVIILPAGF